MLPVVALIGRPNVGKSTLFNAMTGTRDALVADFPGLTRDRQYGYARRTDVPCIVVDTGGLVENAGQIESLMIEQTEQAIAEADRLIVVVDGRAGVTPQDQFSADLARRSGKPVVLAVNKTEGFDHDVAVADFHQLGLGEPLPVAAAHDQGVTALLETALAGFFAADYTDEEQTSGIKIAVIGRPNVGKSTLINRLLGENRMVAFDEPGTTRDAVMVPFERDGERYTLIDTAGLRRRARVEEAVEKFSVIKALQAIETAHVVVAVVDAHDNVVEQDASLLGAVIEQGRALVLAVNKWDLVTKPKETLERISERVADSLPQLAGLKPLTLSATTGDGTGKLVPAAFAAFAAWNRRVPTPTLNRFLVRVQERNPPPLVAGRRLKLRYMTQVNIRPPTFALFASKPGELPESWRRYLVNLLREQFDLPGVPIRMMLRKGKNPFASAR
jgi:GTP-binding protein